MPFVVAIILTECHVRLSFIGCLLLGLGGLLRVRELAHWAQIKAFLLRPAVFVLQRRHVKLRHDATEANTRHDAFAVRLQTPRTVQLVERLRFDPHRGGKNVCDGPKGLRIDHWQFLASTQIHVLCRLAAVVRHGFVVAGENRLEEQDVGRQRRLLALRCKLRVRYRAKIRVAVRVALGPGH